MFHYIIQLHHHNWLFNPLLFFCNAQQHPEKAAISARKNPSSPISKDGFPKLPDATTKSMRYQGYWIGLGDAINNTRDGAINTQYEQF